MADFGTLELSRETVRSLAAMGFEEPTPIQARAIPCLLEGRDVVAQALTGTGKTAAYGVPLVERIDVKRAVPQAIVLLPTRELAVQVTDQLARIGQQRRVGVVPIYGGQPIDRQLRTLRRGVHAVVATPGRLMDHMRRGTVDLTNVGLLVLDEADQMLEMGFIEDIEYVLAHLPEERVTALFSATMPDPIVQIARRHMRDPEMIQLSGPRELTVPEIDQAFYQVPFHRKADALCRVLATKQPERTVVFCATKRMVDEVVEGLQARGYLAEGLHGDMSQAVREKVLRAFRAGRIEVLVATDVAARGLDIPEVSHVVNFDIPADPEYYVHRIGRTGRFGRRGEAITFVNPREMRALKIIERITGARIRREEVPTAEDVEEREMETLQERLQEVLARGTWGRYRAVVEEMLDDRDPVDVAAAALAMVAARSAASRRLGDGDGPVHGSRPPERRDGTTAPSERPRSEGAVRERGSDDQEPRRRPKVVFRPNAGGPRKPGRPWKPGRPPARSFSGPPRDGGNPRQQQGRPFRGGRGAPRRPMNNG